MNLASDPPPLVVDLFAGPGGWDTGLAMLEQRLRVVGIEWDRAACLTGHAAGHVRVRADVTSLDPRSFGAASGVIASPPCQDWSTAGSKTREDGDSGRYVREALRWVLAIRPEWTAWEQVPLAVDVWRECAVVLRHHGYNVWVGVLNAADFGVPQERRRAFLIASRIARVAPPTPTHSEHPDGLFDRLEPWVTLAEAIGIGEGWVYDSGQNSKTAGSGKARYIRSCDRPSGTVTGQTTGQWVFMRGDERRKLVTTEAARLQTFPVGYPWCGKRDEVEQQIGDAVPPVLAAHVIAACLGVEVEVLGRAA